MKTTEVYEKRWEANPHCQKMNGLQPVTKWSTHSKRLKRQILILEFDFPLIWVWARAVFQRENDLGLRTRKLGREENVTNRLGHHRGSGRGFPGSGIWSKYGVGFGKTQNYWRDSGTDCSPGSGIPQNFCTGYVIVCLSIGNSGNLHNRNKRTSGESESARWTLNCTLKEAHQMVKAVSSYCNGTIENVK